MRLSEEQKATMRQLFVKHGLDYEKARDSFQKQYSQVPETESARYWRLCRYQSDNNPNSLVAKATTRTRTRTRNPKRKTLPISYRLSADPDILR